MNKKGMTLIEVLVAAAIFLCIMTLTNYAYKLAQNSLALYERKVKTLYELRSEMETLRLKAFDELLLLNGGVFAAGEGRIEAIALTPDLLRIKVESHNRSLVTIKGKH